LFTPRNCNLSIPQTTAPRALSILAKPLLKNPIKPSKQVLLLLHWPVVSHESGPLYLMNLGRDSFNGLAEKTKGIWCQNEFGYGTW
jgi:hypothetical protein